jgi:putative membrane protein
MNQILLILHLFGFGAAVAVSIGNVTVMRLIGAAPADAPILSKVSAVLGRVGQGAIGLLWLTGLIMVWSKWSGPQNLPILFWWKFACVVAITGIVVLIDLTVKQIQAGNRALAARMPIFGAASATLLVLIVIFAVFAFD